MDEEEKISWSFPEYEEREHNTDWFWALGVIVITSSLTAIIYSNYFFAILILLSGSLLYFFSKKSPEMINYEITNKGLTIESHLYPYQSIQSFYVQKHGEPMLFIKTERFYMPIISIPIEYNMADEIHELFLLKNITLEEMQEHPSEKIIRTLGF